ncbi:MAG: hypothetical protein GC152_11385 [Alphaproteobacteria bacterium]|nr:hypothetical protein [Alphaproteobacteria bacterium]
MLSKEFLGAAAATSIMCVSAEATVTNYRADLQDINNLGASGVATLAFDDVSNQLQVNIAASGLDADQVHVAHIHGRSDSAGNPIDSVTPDISVDEDGDGFIELAEAAPSYGPILLGLSMPAGLDPLGSEGGFSTAPGGAINFSFLYDLNADIFFGGADVSDLTPLFLREIVIHGAFVGAAGDGTGGEVNGVAGYKPTLPALVGEISEVPLPAASALFLAGLAGLPLFRKSRSRKNRRRPPLLST